MMSTLSLIDQVTQKIRSEGGRMTGQRKSILEILEQHPGHPTAEEIYARVRLSDPEINLSTIYRTLRWLEENGFVSPRWFEDDGRRERFDPVTTAEDDGEHFHFRCRVCNRITEFEEPLMAAVRSAFAERSGAAVDSATLVLYGVCEECQRESAS
jgi:Fe2+ or Zn2+ uptake regulation protein